MSTESNDPLDESFQSFLTHENPMMKFFGEKLNQGLNHNYAQTGQAFGFVLLVFPILGFEEEEEKRGGLPVELTTNGVSKGLLIDILTNILKFMKGTVQ